MHDFIDGIRPLDDVLYDIQEYCEKGTSLKKKSRTRLPFYRAKFQKSD